VSTRSLGGRSSWGADGETLDRSMETKSIELVFTTSKVGRLSGSLRMESRWSSNNDEARERRVESKPHHFPVEFYAVTIDLEVD